MVKMLAFPKMIIQHAEKAGIKVPPDVDNYKPEDYTHWHVFCNLQLACPLVSWDEPWTNAEVVAKIPANEIKTITMEEIEQRGFIGLNIVRD